MSGKYLSDWKLTINKQNCELINFSRKQKQQENNIIKLDRYPIKEVKTLKYLGVTLDRKLKYTEHVKTTVKSLILYLMFCFHI